MSVTIIRLHLAIKVPKEITEQWKMDDKEKFGGIGRIWTYDLQRFKMPLYQLSYNSIKCEVGVLTVIKGVGELRYNTFTNTRSRARFLVGIE